MLVAALPAAVPVCTVAFSGTSAEEFEDVAEEVALWAGFVGECANHFGDCGGGNYTLL